MSGVLEGAGVKDTILWPHPPWEQHAIVAKALATGFAEESDLHCSMAADQPCPVIGDISNLNISNREATRVDCDVADGDKSGSAWLDAKFAVARGSRRLGAWTVRGVVERSMPSITVSSTADKLGTSWDAEQSLGWSLYEDRPEKPGWISVVDWAANMSTMKSDPVTFTVGEAWAPWLGFGLRRLLLQVSFFFLLLLRALWPASTTIMTHQTVLVFSRSRT